MKETIYSWISILLGCTILAAGFVFFINPYNIIPGGVYGASIVLHNLFPSIQVGTFGYMFDIPLPFRWVRSVICSTSRCLFFQSFCSEPSWGRVP